MHFETPQLLITGGLIIDRPKTFGSKEQGARSSSKDLQVSAISRAFRLAAPRTCQISRPAGFRAVDPKGRAPVLYGRRITVIQLDPGVLPLAPLLDQDGDSWTVEADGTTTEAPPANLHVAAE